MISKDTLENLKNEKIKVDLTDIHAVAQAFKSLKEIEDLVKGKMDILKTVLVDNKVNELFEDDLMKVVFQEGATMTELDSEIVCEALSIDEIKQTAKFSAKALKDINREDIAIKAKVVKGQKAPSIKVSKMTKAEVKVLQESKLK